jgi:hypothetical protein
MVEDFLPLLIPAVVELSPAAASIFEQHAKNGFLPEASRKDEKSIASIILSLSFHTPSKPPQP